MQVNPSVLSTKVHTLQVELCQYLSFLSQMASFAKLLMCWVFLFSLRKRPFEKEVLTLASLESYI